MGPTHTFGATSHPLRVHSGQHALAQLGHELASAGARRALLLCGRSVHGDADFIAHVGSLAGGRIAGVCPDIGAGAPRDQVERAAEQAAAMQADALVAIGAGSVTKAARVVAIRLAEAGPLEHLATQYDAQGRGRSTRLAAPKLPIFNVLTAATSSQNRGGASILDTATGRSLEFFDPKTRPRAVFWDARALLTAPVSLTRDAAGMEYWWALMNLADAASANPLVLASRRQCWALAQAAMPRIADRDDWRVRVELCAGALLRTRDEDDGGAPLGVVPGTRDIRMHPITRATYMLAQGLAASAAPGQPGITQPRATMALAAPAVRAFGDLCPAVVDGLAALLDCAPTAPEVADRLEHRLAGWGFALRLPHEGGTAQRVAATVDQALRNFNCNADGWMNDKADRLRAMLAAAL